MSWFRRNKDNQVQIPAVPEPSRDGPTRRNDGPGGDPSQPVGRQSNYHPPSNATYNPSRDKDLYGGRSVPASDSPVPSRRVIGDPYTLRSSRHPGGVEQDRAELFAGYDPATSQPARAKSSSYGGGGDGDGEGEQAQQEVDEDEEVENIKKDLRWTKQETVGSSRNALRLAREAEEVGRATLLKLGDQSEKLADTQRHLDVAKAHTNRAADATAELKVLNRSIFRPAITFNKTAKRRAEEARIEARHAEEREERERAMSEVRETQNRVGKAATYGMQSSEEQIARKANRVRGDDRKRFQFEATESDEELEDELDDNLDEILDVSKRLKALAMAGGEEVDKQNVRLAGLADQTSGLNVKIDQGTEKLKRIK